MVRLIRLESLALLLSENSIPFTWEISSDLFAGHELSWGQGDCLAVSAHRENALKRVIEENKFGCNVSRIGGYLIID